MYVRITRGQPKPGQIAELAKRWETHAAPRLQQVPGFQHAYFSGDITQNTAVAVSLWDEPPDTEAMNRAMKEFMGVLDDITAGPPTIDTYEVLAQVQAR